MRLLTSFGLTPEQAVDLLTHPSIYQSQSEQGELGPNGLQDILMGGMHSLAMTSDAKVRSPNMLA